MKDPEVSQLIDLPLFSMKFILQGVKVIEIPEIPGNTLIKNCKNFVGIYDYKSD